MGRVWISACALHIVHNGKAYPQPTGASFTRLSTFFAVDSMKETANEGKRSGASVGSSCSRVGDSLIWEEAIQRAGLEEIAEKVLARKRLSFEDGIRLYQSGDLNLVGWLANVVRERWHGNVAYYVRNQHINYTNICDKRCRFCSFYARQGGSSPYVLNLDEVRQRLRQYRHLPIAEVHVVGGIHPGLPYQYYLDLLRTIREERPGVPIKAFTMIELQQIRKVANKPLEEVLQDLKAAGLDSCPGGGVEVLSDRLHEILFDRKLSGEEWLATARAVHQAGLRSNATMLYGHLETEEERVEHLLRLRALQDETGGFLTFIPLSFHPENTELAHLPGPTGCDDLLNIALARLMLDNVPHVKAFWVMCSPGVAQVALWYGADDIDGTVLRYEVTRDARTDTHQELTQDQLVALIRSAGRDAVERDALYGVVACSACPPAHRPGLPSFSQVAQKVQAGLRLDADDALALFSHPNLVEVGILAHTVRQRKNPGRTVTYVVGRNINYTNVCWVQCRFCNFHRRPSAKDAYVLSHEEIFRKIEEVLELGGTEILLQGGLNPRLRLEWFEDLFRAIKARYPVHLHGLSPTEVLDLARTSGLGLRETLLRLRSAGLDSLPGGGAELLVDSVKERIAPNKHSPDEWLEVMRVAHHLGIPSTATMVFGFGETLEQRIEHLMRLRALQDETGGFTAFIAWSFQPEGTALGGERATACDYLRTVAVARLVLDNIPHVQASWLTQGPRIGQIALHYGVDDFGSTVLEENVITAPSGRFLIPVPELERLIRVAGFVPRRRNTLYELLP